MEAWTAAGATSAGLYDALWGGKDNYAADRAAAAAAADVYPGVRDAALANRAFLTRATAWAFRQGITQTLDLGCGYSPVVYAAAAGKVALIDNDPVVASHARALCPGAIALEADLQDTDGILRECEDGGFSLDEPAAVVMGLVAQYFPAQAVRELTGRYVSRLAPGSMVILSAWVCDELAGPLGRTHPARLHRQTAADVASFLAGLDVVDPGIVRAALWKPEQPVGMGARPVLVLAGAGVKP